MKKNLYVILFASLFLLSLCGCTAIDAVDPANISANDFSDGNHPRDEEYGAAFQTKSVALAGLNIHFATSVFDASLSPDLAEQIAADYVELCALGAEWTHPVDIYIVTATTTGKPVVVVDSDLFCTTECIENREYLPFLTSCTFDLEPWWQCVGLSCTAFEDAATSLENLSGLLRDYASKNTTSYILSLAPCYFIRELADEETQDLAKKIAQSLTEYILSQHDMETYLTDGCNLTYRSAWLDGLDISMALEGMDTQEASRVSALPLSCTDDIPWIIQEQNFQLNIQSVDWMSTADDIYDILIEFYQSANQLYAHLEQKAPVFYATMQQDQRPRTSITFYDSNYAVNSWTTLGGQQAAVINRADTLHELVHGLMPVETAGEMQWLSEGLATYISAPCLSYDAAPAVVDSIASDAQAAKLSESLREMRDEIVDIFEAMTGQDISQIYQMDQPISLIYQATGYAVCLHPEYKNNTGFSFATASVNERAGVDNGYVGNELSYPQAMVFVQYLVKKYGLDAIIEAEMDLDAYRALFPNTTAFQDEYGLFLEELDFKQ